MQSEATPDLKVVTFDVSDESVSQWAIHAQGVYRTPALYIYKTADQKSDPPRVRADQVTGRQFVPALRVMFEHALKP